ncbi:PREDICTED: ATP-dependent DNA helicase 2 subunit 1-like [Priapulus caudatus]|uniref:ATP-dependent DNA helicase 2 subunit 1-like n=1 Tax=Priapulus caudatus TaxID=37621 RepID=A0ABM1ED84_PRICU|nr:PREDICTED: ATP-dependent DNA helicase 2 subunit 1-like [Priapulus caudatus]
MMEKRAGRHIEEFKQMVFPDGFNPEAAKAGARKRAAGNAGGAAKKPKLEGVAVDVKAEALAGKLGKMTVAVLRQYCKDEGIRLTGTKKSELMDAINEYLNL